MFEKILALSPHADDAELGAGGTLAKFIEDGKQVYYAALSTYPESVTDEFPPDVVKQEVEASTKSLGVPAENLFVFDFEVRRFPDKRQEILEELISLRKKIEPDLVLVHSLTDVHQDHKIVTEEAMRAFRKNAILWGYEQSWNQVMTQNYNLFVPLTEGNLGKKIEAVGKYESQKHRNYFNPDVITAQARSRGIQIGRQYAEIFEIFRWILDAKKHPFI